MKTIELGKSGLHVPQIAVGCMRLNRLDKAEAKAFLFSALDQGANFFDHADIYGGGACEEIFAQALGMSPSLRETLLLQSKCGIRKGMYDFSKEHILTSVDGILKRLQTEYLDVLLLHRPDTLMEPDEVAEAFATLHQSGKVRHFGVSNHDTHTILLLQAALGQKIHANQLQLSLTNATLISQSMNMNQLHDQALDRDNGTLAFCRLHNITVQAWSPFQYGFFDGVFLENEKFSALNAELEILAENYHVSKTTVALAWLLRHPANIQPVVGTMNQKRLTECLQAAEISLSRQEWYGLYRAAGHRLP